MRMLGSVVRILAATAAFAVVHSALASARAKHLAARALGGGERGRRRRDAFYRPLYNAQAAVASAALVRYVAKLPDRELYHVRGAAGVLMRSGQALALGCFVAAVRRVGLLRFVGAPPLIAHLSGKPVPPPMEAQGPARDDAGRIDGGGVFRMSRHPLNFVGVPLLWLNPRMTVNLATFAAAATVYFYVGSIHEERRLRRAYGAPYQRYVESGAPFFLPVKTRAPIVQTRPPASGFLA